MYPNNREVGVIAHGHSMTNLDVRAHSTTKRTQMKLQEFLDFHLARMLECFNLKHFELTIKKARISATMDISVDTQYLYGTIRYGKRICKKYKDGEKEFVLKSLCHEIVHCFTSQISCFHKSTKLRLKAEEQVTEHLSRLLYKHYKQYVKEVYRV